MMSNKNKKSPTTILILTGLTLPAKSDRTTLLERAMEPDINPDIRKRIVAAADQLFGQSADGSFPNVDAVRRAARANMNDTSAVMKSWRRTCLAKAAPVPLVIPEPVQQSNSAGLEHLWRTAQECANQHLRTAQAGWELERAESDALCQQLSKAFDEQAQSAAEQHLTLQAAQESLQVTEERVRAAVHDLAARTAENTVVAARAERAEARLTTLEERAVDQKEQLAHANAMLVRAHDDLESACRRGDEMVDGLRAELRAAIRSAADTALELAVARSQADGLQDTLAASAAQCRTLEQGIVHVQAIATQAQERAAAFSDELEIARREVADRTAAVHDSRVAAATIQAERDAMAVHIEQLLATIKAPVQAAPTGAPRRRRSATLKPPNGEADQ